MDQSSFVIAWNTQDLQDRSLWLTATYSHICFVWQKLCDDIYHNMAYLPLSIPLDAHNAMFGQGLS